MVYVSTVLLYKFTSQYNTFCGMVLNKIVKFSVYFYFGYGKVLSESEETILLKEKKCL